MLRLIVGEEEGWNEEEQEFVTSGGIVVELEHSLVSLSKWEQIHRKPFLGSEQKTSEEVFSYFHLMCLNDVDPNFIYLLTEKQLDQINDYLNSPESATTFRNSPGGKSGETITSELIYYWMVAFRIPFECQYWHLNRLFTLIQICGIKNSPPKKMSRAEQARQFQEANARRRAEMGSKG